MSKHVGAISIMRLPLTTPCPVMVTPDGRWMDDDGEPLPLDERTEYCAVDAGWMIGMQRCCDVHLQTAVDIMEIDGGFESIVREMHEEYGNEDEAWERAQRPWKDRKRYSQEEAAQWAESAKAHGMA